MKRLGTASFNFKFVNVTDLVQFHSNNWLLRGQAGSSQSQPRTADSCESPTESLKNLAFMVTLHFRDSVECYKLDREDAFKTSKS